MDRYAFYFRLSLVWLAVLVIAVTWLLFSL